MMDDYSGDWYESRGSDSSGRSKYKKLRNSGSNQEDYVKSEGFKEELDDDDMSDGFD